MNKKKENKNNKFKLPYKGFPFGCVFSCFMLKGEDTKATGDTHVNHFN